MALGVVPICMCAGVSNVITTRKQYTTFSLLSCVKDGFYCFVLKVIETEERYQAVEGKWFSVSSLANSDAG